MINFHSSFARPFNKFRSKTDTNNAYDTVELWHVRQLSACGKVCTESQMLPHSAGDVLNKNVTGAVRRNETA